MSEKDYIAPSQGTNPRPSKVSGYSQIPDMRNGKMNPTIQFSPLSFIFLETIPASDTGDEDRHPVAEA
jgi:hypothetical protein